MSRAVLTRMRGLESKARMNSPFNLRLARVEDVPLLEDLIKASVRGLQANDYSPEQLEGALESVYGVDTQLIADGTYFAVEHLNKDIVGCGGWSKRKTLYGGDVWRGREDSLLDPSRDAARIRAFFVHPRWARKALALSFLTRVKQPRKKPVSGVWRWAPHLQASLFIAPGAMQKWNLCRFR